MTNTDPTLSLIDKIAEQIACEAGYEWMPAHTRTKERFMRRAEKIGTIIRQHETDMGASGVEGSAPCGQPMPIDKAYLEAPANLRCGEIRLILNKVWDHKLASTNAIEELRPYLATHELVLGDNNGVTGIRSDSVPLVGEKTVSQGQFNSAAPTTQQPVERIDLQTRIDIWSIRPQPGTPMGDAWEQGCKQGYEWGIESAPERESVDLRTVMNTALGVILNYRDVIPRHIVQWAEAKVDLSDAVVIDEVYKDITN